MAGDGRGLCGGVFLDGTRRNEIITRKRVFEPLLLNINLVEKMKASKRQDNQGVIVG